MDHRGDSPGLPGRCVGSHSEHRLGMLRDGFGFGLDKGWMADGSRLDILLIADG